MRINPIFGFLGSGKTTLVKRILEERGGDERTAVIVNEFGDVGIDGAILKGNNVNMVQLTSGCLCCTLKGPLMAAIIELRKSADVERTVIEATGIAQPNDLADALHDPQLGADITVGAFVTVVDGLKFSMLNQALGPFYPAQVAYADIVLLNKTDIVPADTLETARREIAVLNPEAALILTEHCDVDLALLLDGEGGDGGDHGDTHGDTHGDAHGHDHAHDHAHFDSFVADAGGAAPRARIEAFFAALPSTVYRAKGFMTIDGRPSLVQFSAGQLEITAAEARDGRHMVFIGEKLDQPAIEAAFAFASG